MASTGTISNIRRGIRPRGSICFKTTKRKQQWLRNSPQALLSPGSSVTPSKQQREEASSAGRSSQPVPETPRQSTPTHQAASRGNQQRRSILATVARNAAAVYTRPRHSHPAASRGSKQPKWISEIGGCNTASDNAQRLRPFRRPGSIPMPLEGMLQRNENAVSAGCPRKNSASP